MPRAKVLPLLAGLLPGLAGCSGPQSALDPAGPSAQSLYTLGLVMYVGATVVTLLVTAVMIWPFVRRRHVPANRRLFLWGGGVALPSLAILGLIPYVLVTGDGMRQRQAAYTIDATGFVYWWEMSYRLPDGRRATTANELRLPLGVPVEIRLRSDDVIHSFWVPSLAGKTDMIPGRVNRMVLQADRIGFFRGQCAEYCGAQHALMAFDVIVTGRAEFDSWLARMAESVPEPGTPDHARGRDLFVASGCGTCHAVRGVAEGQRGPDLTNVGARLSLAAGVYPNNVGTIAGWIVAPQQLKPGNRMPAFANFTGPELRALAGWLESLK